MAQPTNLKAVNSAMVLDYEHRAVTISNVEHAYLCTLRGAAAHYPSVNRADEALKRVLSAMDAPIGVYGVLRPHLRGAMTILFLDVGGIRRSAYDATDVALDTTTDHAVALAVLGPLIENTVSDEILGKMTPAVEAMAADVRQAGEEYRRQWDLGEGDVRHAMTSQFNP